MHYLLGQESHLLWGRHPSLGWIGRHGKVRRAWRRGEVGEHDGGDPGGRGEVMEVRLWGGAGQLWNSWSSGPAWRQRLHLQHGEQQVTLSLLQGKQSVQASKLQLNMKIPA